jgi:long-chain fatty acid transport protein
MPRSGLGTACLLLAFSIPAVTALPGGAAAAGIERVVPSARLLFREGGFAQFELAHIRPRHRGTGGSFAGEPIEGRTGNVFDSYEQASFTIRDDIAPRLSYAVTVDQPWGADTFYRQGTVDPAVAYEGIEARIRSRALTTILAYDATDRIKVYAGLRAQRTEAEATIPFLGYGIDAAENWALGYLVGAGYHIPEIALHVALTYHSRMRHDFAMTEVGPFGTIESVIDVDLPQSVTLEFQSGVAPDTLVFGSIRWVDWTEFDIIPPGYTFATGNPLVDYQNDWWTFTLGAGRRFSETWAASVSALWEPRMGEPVMTLGPADGRTAITGAVTWSEGPFEVTGGVTFGLLGRTRNILGTEFEDGSYAGLGLRLGTRF